MNDTVKLALTNAAVLFGIAMVSALLTDFAKTGRLPSIECLYYAFLTALLAFLVTLGHARKRSRARKKMRRLDQKTLDSQIKELRKSTMKQNLRLDKMSFMIKTPYKTSGPVVNDLTAFIDDDHDLLCVVI